MLKVNQAQFFYSKLKSLFFSLPPEKSHQLAVLWLPWLVEPKANSAENLTLEVLGKQFANPFMMAAGFDKEGSLAGGIRKLGAAAVESGTFTFLPQPGNPKPRLFRDAKRQILLNRMGFNNPSLEIGLKNMAKSASENRFLTAISLGKGKNTSLAEAHLDYQRLIQDGEDFLRRNNLSAQVPYWAINISSPNTPDLRKLQTPRYLSSLLANLNQLSNRPIMVKLAPDFNQDKDFFATIDAALKAEIAGFIIHNTSSSQTLKQKYGFQDQEGGLSGSCLRSRSLQLLRKTRRHIGWSKTVISSGGIMHPADAWQSWLNGADLIQFYSGLIFYGPSLFLDCRILFQKKMKALGYQALSEMIQARKNNALPVR